MIINVGARTDIINYYSEWMFRRFEEGFVYSRNPLFPKNVSRYELSPDKVDAVLFCSKNYAPALPKLERVTARFPAYFYYTITAYGKDVEPNVPDFDTSVDTLIALSRLVGRERVAWRYDPILISGKYSPEVHFATFDHLARRLAPHVDRCIFSFVELYAKLRNNLPDLCTLDGAMRTRMAEGLGRIAASHRLPIQTCADETDYS